MKKLSTLLILSMLMANAIAQTNVSGFINANTNWTLAGAPYIVVGNALLSHGYTLTIDPGVVVKFDSAKALQIDGELIAIGTSTSRITFTSNQITPASGDWAKIHFSDTCVDAVFDTSGDYVSGCIMKYCDVLYSGGVGYGAIHNGTSSPYFSQCRIINSLAAGIFAQESCTIDSSVIKNCSGYAINFASAFVNYCAISVTNDSIVSNAGGISISPGSISCNQNSTISIRNNTFLSNLGNAAIVGNYILYNTTISENKFINNSLAVIIEVGQGFINGEIECNTFINNNVAASVLGVYNNGGYAIISNNLFDGNSSATGPSVGDFSNEGSNLFFRNNIVRNNTSATGACCKFSYYRVTIDHNHFENNIGVSTINLLGTPSNNTIAYFQYNNFSNPGCQYEIYNSVPYTASNIYTDSNYWGTTNTQHVDSVIYDYFDDANKSVVFYMPVLATPVNVDTACPAIQTYINTISNNESHFLLYPNPAHNTFTIYLNNQSSINNNQLTIFDVTGRVVHEQKINSQVSTVNCQLSAGVYFVKVTAGERVYAQKLVIE